MKKRTVSQISKDELSAWPTKRLLGRLNALRRLEECPEKSDVDEYAPSSDSDIRFKSDPRWNNAYRELKSILDGRENIRSGKADRLTRMTERRR
ncbi:MAG: hypothetical protein AAGJ86_06435 [Pseudomonadota bacterium]